VRKPIAACAAVAMVTLAACGGSAGHPAAAAPAATHSAHPVATANAACTAALSALAGARQTVTQSQAASDAATQAARATEKRLTAAERLYMATALVTLANARLAIDFGSPESKVRGQLKAYSAAAGQLRSACASAG
jgi:hypothetical protein